MAKAAREKEKSFKISRPKTVPPKRDKRTFFEYKARAMARREGIKERMESSMTPS